MEEMLPEQGRQDKNGDHGNVDLFEKIREDLQLLYISDIPRLGAPERLILSVKCMNTDAYSQRQWKDLLLYILKTE